MLPFPNKFRLPQHTPHTHPESLVNERPSQPRPIDILHHPPPLPPPVAITTTATTAKKTTNACNGNTNDETTAKSTCLLFSSHAGNVKIVLDAILLSVRTTSDNEGPDHNVG
mmetsp:Transcript_23239/g.28476  ORF Transcript_23239/g.28476 Transcript_23239/m.28476 type:complete len:112 (-) Transcript_23239:143-478(-)